MSRFTMEELRKEVARELTYRRKVYPRLVQQHTLSQKLADEQTAKMEAIHDILEELASKERLL